MKTKALLLAAVFLTLIVTVSGYSQGTVNFGNKVNAVVGFWPAIDAPVSYGSDGPATAGLVNGGITTRWGGSTCYAQLWGGPVGTAENNLQPLFNGTESIVQFRSGAAAGYILTASRDIPGTNPGDNGVVQFRVWDNGVQGATWADALASPEYYFYKSPLMTVGPLGGDASGATPASLYDINTQMALQPMVLYGPEPSTIGLCILGAIAGLLVFRHRK